MPRSKSPFGTTHISLFPPLELIQICDCIIVHIDKVFKQLPIIDENYGANLVSDSTRQLQFSTPCPKVSTARNTLGSPRFWASPPRQPTATSRNGSKKGNSRKLNMGSIGRWGNETRNKSRSYDILLLGLSSMSSELVLNEKIKMLSGSRKFNTFTPNTKQF